MRTLALLALALTACETERWRSECDAAQQERVFLECVRTAQLLGGASAAGNDSDEVIDSCHDAAFAIACRRVCFSGCSRD